MATALTREELIAAGVLKPDGGTTPPPRDAARGVRLDAAGHAAAAREILNHLDAPGALALDAPAPEVASWIRRLVARGPLRRAG